MGHGSIPALLRNAEDYVHRVGRTGCSCIHDMLVVCFQMFFSLSCKTSGGTGICALGQGRIGNKGVATSFVGRREPALKDWLDADALGYGYKGHFDAILVFQAAARGSQ